MTYETISLNTKKMIEQKFKELVCKKPLSKVTISDFKEFLIEFYTEAIASTLIDWIVDYPNADKDKTVGYLSKIINNITF